FAALMKKLTMEFHGGDPKWYYIPADQTIIDQMIFLLIGKGNPGDYAGLVDIPFQEAQVISFFRDHLPTTVNAAVDNTKAFIKALPPPKGVDINFASGSIGLTKAVNDELSRSYWLAIGVVLFFIFVFCLCAFRSVVAALILVIPLFISRAIVFSMLYFMNIGETVASLTVMAVSMGIGVDFGIYILARIQEEYIREKDLQKAVHTGMGTAGRGVLFSSVTIIFPVALWYLLSDVRFWGETGLFLAGLLLVSLIVSLVFVPAILVALKPKFIIEHDVNK
ncbi:MAG: efflux RND transporter permease subunit, partial [Syntrophales bacterium]|nr:efflux RND transporter permease subunit [Syntrophales bacterium]